jgi:RNA polymerase sigma-70 factor (ECF subfamily)
MLVPGEHRVTDRSKSGQSPPSRADRPSPAVAPSPEFDTLFTTHYAYVCRTLSYLGVPAATVEDAAQDVFMVLHRRLDDYDPARDVRSWLWGIACRVEHTRRRTRARADRKLRVAPPPVSPREPDEELALREQAEIVERFVATLPDKLRDAFVLSQIEGLAAPDVAEALGVPLNTVYSRIRLARERLARRLDAVRAERARVDNDHG